MISDEINRLSVHAFTEAFDTVRQRGLSRSESKLLRFHLQAPRQILSWRELAARVGLAGPNPVKLIYGRLAHRIGIALGLDEPPAGFWLHTIAAWSDSIDSAGHTQFRLRPQMVAALRSAAAAREAGLHIVQGGSDNGDLAWLLRAARRSLRSVPWTVPKTASEGDAVVIYIGSEGFFATAVVDSEPRPRPGHARRYAASLRDITLIEPPISLGTIRRRLPRLTWATYPRSITTPSTSIARKVLALVGERRGNSLPELSGAALRTASLTELRRVAMLSARAVLSPTLRRQLFRARSFAIRRYVLGRANGVCEACGEDAPFTTYEGAPYLEPHHLTRVADGGPDHPSAVAAVCPNCHRRAHHAVDARAFNAWLTAKIVRLESTR